MNGIKVEKIEEARDRIMAYVKQTELTPSPQLSSELKSEIYFKWENHQPTGSFKIRGAANKILSNLAACHERGVVAASTGNHGLASSYVCQHEGLKLSLFLPASISKVKRQKLAATRASLILVDGPCEQAEALARKESELSGKVFVSPYNDPEVVAGQ
ncbi:MAG: pyridoxal-phosphate dependent enzyme, partial [Candidatus Saccharicenans sp.]